MKRYRTLCQFFMISFALCATAHASSVGLVKESVHSDIQALANSKDNAIVLTFGEERVVIYNPPLSLPDSELLAQEVSLSELFLLRDRRPIDERTGYDTIYSHSGLALAVVGNPHRLAATRHVRLWPVTGDMVVTRTPKLDQFDPPNPVVQTVLSMLSSTQYRQTMARLVRNRDVPTRYACADGQLTARDIINRCFSQLGLVTSLVKFKNWCQSGCNSQTGFDVIGFKEGLVRPQEYYLVGAHYDSMSGKPCQSAPGANDNASGMAGVMELARVFSQLNTEASIIFVAFNGEEQGMRGSKKYVRTLVNSGLNVNIKAFVILDMISYYNKTRGIVIEGSDETPQQLAVLDRLTRYGTTYTDLKLETTTYYGDSDHEPFLDQGMAGALLIEADWSKYPYYHTMKDQMYYQNASYGLEVVKLAAAILAQEATVYFPPANPISD